MDINTGIGVGSGHHGRPELKIFEVVVFDRSGVEQMGHGTGNFDAAILDRKGRCIFTNLPTLQIFAIEERYPGLFI
jgi:hypothetical protein